MNLEQFGAQLGSCFCILFSFKQAADAREIRSIAISITSSKRPSGNPAASTQGAAQQQQPSSSTQGAAQEQQEPSS